jgi:cytochrome d ubiquinol oxidase subunit II
MDLNTVWFIMISVLFIGFFFLEGFDFGVGMMVPLLTKDDTE